MLKWEWHKNGDEYYLYLICSRVLPNYFMLSSRVRIENIVMVPAGANKLESCFEASSSVQCLYEFSLSREIQVTEERLGHVE
jgi:hypothetical protein